ncbi:MAG: sigma-54 interaction domain-containing protein [Desulfonatronovibrio sp.]
MNDPLQITPDVESLFKKMEEICHDLAWNRFDRAEELFELTRSQKYPEQIAKLAESFGMMLVKLEAREYSMEQIMARLRETAKELELSRRQLLKENTGLKKGLMKRFSSRRIIGKNPEIRKILDQVNRIADTSVNVLISGETGTGKELIAKALHYNSFRKTAPCITVNCSAIPETLFESELFGIEKGVATGVNKRIGLVEKADGGTLFLDEIPDMPLSCQAKILRLLEEREVTRVGGSEPIQVDIRVVAATNKDLRTEAEAGRFRKDLFFRLNVVALDLPPLRRRKEDIPLLLKRFLQVHCQNMNTPLMEISRDAMQAFVNYDWPGNIREMENEIERLVALSYSPLIRLTDISAEIRQTVEHHEPDSIPSITEAEEHADPFTPARHLPPSPKPDIPDKIQLERTIIQRALQTTGNNKTQAAKLLGMSREGLRKKIKRLF